MKKLLLVLVLPLSLFWSCDDGNLIVTDFDFDSDSQLEVCSNKNSTVFFVINSNPDEAIAFDLSDIEFDGTFEEEEEEQQLIVDLEASNPLIYRSFESKVGSSYFCSGIPSSEPQILKEFHSKEGGAFYITTKVIEEEIDESKKTVKKKFETYVEARNVTLKNIAKEEEIVREVLKLGRLVKSKTFDLSQSE